jgi:hypothetical protein
MLQFLDLSGLFEDPSLLSAKIGPLLATETGEGTIRVVVRARLVDLGGVPTAEEDKRVGWPGDVVAISVICFLPLAPLGGCRLLGELEEGVGSEDGTVWRGEETVLCRDDRSVVVVIVRGDVDCELIFSARLGFRVVHGSQLRRKTRWRRWHVWTCVIYLLYLHASPFFHPTMGNTFIYIQEQAPSRSVTVTLLMSMNTQ